VHDSVEFALTPLSDVTAAGDIHEADVASGRAHIFAAVAARDGPLDINMDERWPVASRAAAVIEVTVRDERVHGSEATAQPAFQT
jgi:hypothetical protein